MRLLLEEEISAGKTHLEKFVAEWDALAGTDWAVLVRRILVLDSLFLFG